MIKNVTIHSQNQNQVILNVEENGTVWHVPIDETNRLSVDVEKLSKTKQATDIVKNLSFPK